VLHLSQALASSEMQGPPLVRLALQTLGEFDFGQHLLLEFVRDHVALYLDDIESATRKAAAHACCQMLEKHEYIRSLAAAGGPVAPGTPQAALIRYMQVRPHDHRQAVERIVQRLLIAAVADIKVSVRCAVFVALRDSKALDDHLSQVDCLRSLFVALNDEDASVRALATQVTTPPRLRKNKLFAPGLASRFVSPSLTSLYPSFYLFLL
jgi:FKBP12-rapamycin complex-associated protein